MLAKLRSAVRDWGVLAAALYVCDRALARIFKGRARIFFYRLEVQPVPTRALLPAHRGKQIEVRSVSREDPALGTMQRPRHVLQDRFDQGGICLGAFTGGQLIGFLWLQFEQYREDEVRCLFRLADERLAWDYDVFVDPAFRAGFAFARLWDRAFELLRGKGATWSASRVSAWNTASLSSHAKLGARSVGSAAFIVLGRMQLTVASLRPFLHWSWGRSSPTLVLEPPQRTA